MPNGHYDDEAGVCWDDDYYHGGSQSYEPQPDEPSFPEHCRNPFGMGYDMDCLIQEKIYEAAKNLWNRIFGDSTS